MKHLKLSLFSVVALGGTLALTGCSGSMGFPDASVNAPLAANISPGNISGSNFGGHAPIVNAKVFMLQVGTNGYGSQATSLINASAGTPDTTIVGGTSTNPTAYYVTTNTAGFFNVPASGYSCIPGYPVYFYAYGGAPDTNPSVGPSNLSSGSLTSNGTYLTETFTVDNEKFYVGQQVTFAGIPAGNEFVNNNGQTFTVSAISTTDNKSFTITTTNAYTGPSQGPFAMSGTVSPIGVQNPGIVNIAVIGNCPSTAVSEGVTISGIPVGTSSNVLTGISASDIAKLNIGDQIVGPGIGPNSLPTTIVAINSTTAPYSITLKDTDTGGNGTNAYSYTVSTYNFESNSGTPVPFVYMNEVATAAAAFAMAPFAETSTISGGVVTRTTADAQHFGIPASDTLAQTGIVNAAANAGQLYDVTGATNTVSSTDGESHVARTYVPNSGGDPLGVNPSTSVTSKGIGKVPQALIDTLGNILASCVDSANTYGLGATGGTASSACATLFKTATSNGVPVSSLGATTPKDIASAAINIAHYPGGNAQGNGTTNPYVSALFGLQTGVVPFLPDLTTAPNDFVIGINITVPQGASNTNYLGNSFTTGTGRAAYPTAIATNAYGEAYVGTTGCGNGSGEVVGVGAGGNGYGCVLQLEPTQLLPALPTVGGVGLAQGVRSLAFGPTGKLWATGTLESNQSVGGFSPPAGAFYIVVNTPSPSNPITYGATGNLSNSYAFAAFGNTQVNTSTSAYTQLFSTPTAIVVNGNGHGYIADSTANYLHDITGVNNGSGIFNYSGVNLDTDYLVQGSGTNCLADVTALALGAATSSYGGAYNLWATSGASTTAQGICTIPDNGTNGVSAAGPTITVNTVNPIEQTGPQYTPTAVAVDANDVGWDANQSPGGTANQTGEGFPNNGLPQYGVEYGFARNQTTTPTAVAIDGNNNLWYANLGSNSVSAYTSPGNVTFIGDNPTAISPAGTGAGNGNGGYTAGNTMSGPTSIAIDLSGDVWVGNTGSTGVGYSVTELIGVAAPTYGPLSAAASANKLGAKP